MKDFFLKRRWFRIFLLYIIGFLIVFFFVDVKKALYQTRLATLNRLRPAGFEYIVEFDQKKALNNKEKLDQFRRYYDKVARFVPDRPDAYGLYGYTSYYLDNQKAALRAYQEALELNPEFLFYYHNLACIYYDQREYQKALETVRKGLLIDPLMTVEGIKKSVRLYVPLIIIKEKAEKKSVEKDIKRAHYNLYIVSTLSYFHLQDYNNMMKAIAGLRLIYPDTKGYFSFYSGVAAFYQNNYPAAIQEFKAALEKNGENYEAWLYLGKTLEKTGNEAYAKNAYQQAERLKVTAEPSGLLEEPPDLFLY